MPNNSNIVKIIGVIAAILIIIVSGWSFINDNKNSISGDKLNLTETPAQQLTQTTMQSAQKLKIEDTQVGDGAEVKKGDIIVINYVGKLLNGTQFDSSYDRGQPFETQIGVGKLIQGWDEGIVGMKVGGKRKLTIPPDKGYGAQGVPGTIPPNATLVFDVELMAIK